MRRIIKNREIVGDGWTPIGDEDELLDGIDVVVSLPRFLRLRADGEAHRGRVAVELRPDDDPALLGPHLSAVDMIAVRFPKFSDGRGYSTARLLRSRLGWQGELRATGDVLPDQVFYMHRCGFDAFEVRADKKLETALRALSTFSVTYQGAEDGVPLYRRRFAARRALASGE
jgi:uncharacterized protein (DUF934 family)